MRLTDDAQGAVEFGRFRLLPHRQELRADGVAVELGGRAFDVLMVLTEARGTLVTKDEIMARVWPDTVVEENNLVVQISALRRALGEDRDFIRTVSGRGYRFNAEIRSSVADTGGKTGLEPEVVPDASTSPSSDLPPPVPSLIGRETPPEEGADLRAGTVGLADGLTSLEAFWLRFSAGARGLVVLGSLLPEPGLPQDSLLSSTAIRKPFRRCFARLLRRRHD
jgi:DNA-binding winged helix-turn-helix (wHTH) protein